MSARELRGAAPSQTGNSSSAATAAPGRRTLAEDSTPQPIPMTSGRTTTPSEPAHDALGRERFLSQLPADAIRVVPSPLVLDRRIAPTVGARVSLASLFGPPAGPQVGAALNVSDAHGAEVGAQRVTWPRAAQASELAAFTFGRAGTYRIAADLQIGDQVVAHRTRAVEVTSPGAEPIAAPAVSATVDLATAAQMSPEQRQAAHGKLTARLAENLAPEARAKLADERNVLELAAANTPGISGAAGGSLATKPTPPTDLITLSGMDRASLDVSADPVFLRRWVEETFIAGGAPRSTSSRSKSTR
jgi:hypothetical protein